MFASFGLRSFASPRRLVSLFVLLALVASALLLAPQAGRVTDAQSVTPTALHTGVVSCGTTGFLPADSASGYTIGSGHWMYWTGGGSSYFSCPVTLPNKSVVTKVQSPCTATTEDSVCPGVVTDRSMVVFTASRRCRISHALPT